MFTKFKTTNFPPESKSILVWDGKCGFCKYWVTRWKKVTGDAIDYKTFQEVADHFPDIPLKEFKKASRLIEPSGEIYSGPDSAYRSYDYAQKRKYPYHSWYVKHMWFQKISDHGYNYIAKHRPMFYELTKAFFGPDPKKLKHLWLYYVLALWSLILIASLLF